MDGLAARGHSIRVLTNYPERTPHGKNIPQSYPVIRKLHNRRKARFFPKELLFDLLDTRLLQRQIKEFQPDVIYLGHTYILSKALLPFLARMTIPIVYDEGGSGLIEAWTEHGRWFRFTGDYKSRFALLNAIKPLVTRMVCAASRGRITSRWTWPENMRIHFNSELNRSNAQRDGVPIENSKVIHSGIDTILFTYRPRERLSTPVKIIVPGRIERRKGQLDAVHLVESLLKEGIDTHLVLAGSGWVDGYYQEVTYAIRTSGLSERISILPMLSPEALAEHYRDADICFFTSYFRTGFSRVPLEAMACGCVVISYGNEGSDEVIENGYNGILVNEGDFSSMLKSIQKLNTSPDFFSKIINNGRVLVEDKHYISQYINSIEKMITD